jgi:hypothetical protein
MLNLSCGGSHHKFPINMWTYGKLCPSMVAILDTISFYGGHLGYCPSMEVILDTMSFYGGHLGLDTMSFNGDHLGHYVLQWRSSWILCPSMVVILDTMSFCGGHLGFSISPKITHFVKKHSNVIHNKFNFNERWQQIQNWYQTWYFLKGILEFEEHFLIHRCFWKVKNEIVYRLWHYVYISNNLLNSTQVIEWKPNVGCTWIKHTIPGLYV